MERIYALASARGKAGVSVVRISGEGLRDELCALVRKWPEPRRSVVRRLWVDDEVLDEALVIFFPKGGSFTGEEILELHVHGSPAIVSKLLGFLGGLDGFRLAQPGEFTRRALLNGRLDLTQVEGLADLIDAETEAQRRQAMKVFSGDLAKKYESWRGHLLKAAAYIAATIDFTDEDLPDTLIDAAYDHVSRVLEDLKDEAAGFRVSERIRDGFEVAILGKPNVGKSTLLNRIAGREAALISAIPGTTRDIIEVRMDVGGLPVTFLDTAGIRESDDQIEAMGIERAVARANLADLRVFLTDGDTSDLPISPQDHDIVAVAKDDGGMHENGISGATGFGISWLLKSVERSLLPLTTSSALITRQRHREAVEDSIEALVRFQEAKLESALGVEILSMHLNEALVGLDFLMGKFDIEDVLGEIFSSFCIGK